MFGPPREHDTWRVAECLVALAVGAADRPRVEWDECDVRVPAGRIEVKADAYLQAWDQRSLSKIVFTGLRGRMWTPQVGYSSAATYNADGYVFGVVTAIEHAF
jgi:hypothetical protein